MLRTAVPSQPSNQKAILVVGFEWAKLGFRQVCFPPAPAPARSAPACAHADTTSSRGSAAPVAVPNVDPDAAAAAVATAAYSSVSVTRASTPATVLVVAFSTTDAIIMGFDWVILGSRPVCLGFGLIVFSPLQLYFRR